MLWNITTISLLPENSPRTDRRWLYTLSSTDLEKSTISRYLLAQRLFFLIRTKLRANIWIFTWLPVGHSWRLTVYIGVVGAVPSILHKSKPVLFIFNPSYGFQTKYKCSCWCQAYTPVDIVTAKGLGFGARDIWYVWYCCFEEAIKNTFYINNCTCFL